MKKAVLFLIALLLLFGLCACRTDPQDATVPAATEAPAEAPTEPPTEPSVPEEGFCFPAGTALFGVDIGEMTPQDACAAINTALADYQLKLTVNGRAVTLTQAAIGLTCPEAEVLTYASQLEQAVAEPVMPKLSYDRNLLRQKLTSALNISPRDAAVSYSVISDTFVIIKEAPGKNVELNGILAEAEPVILSLGQELSVSAATSEVKPKLTADDPVLKDAQAKANAFLAISLTYTYTPDSGESLGSQALTKDEIGSFIYFEEDHTPAISASDVAGYADKMGSKYSVAGGTGNFKTSGGPYINLTVSYAGQPVDTDALAKDRDGPRGKRDGASPWLPCSGMVPPSGSLLASSIPTFL